MREGYVESVDPEIARAFLAADALAGQPVVVVDDGEDFLEAESVSIDGTVYELVSVDLGDPEDESATSTLTLGANLGADVEAGEPVDVSPEKLTLWATVSIPGEVDSLTIRVPQTPGITLPLGIRTPESREVVTYDEGADGPEITSIAGRGLIDASTALNPDTKIPMLNLDEDGINGQITQMWGLIAQQIDVDIVLAGGTIVVGDQNGSHIVLDKVNGLTLYGPDGMTPTVRLDLSDEQLSTFTGKIDTEQLSVMQSLELKGTLSKLMNSAVLTLVSTVASPTAPPTLSQGPNTRPWKAPSTDYTEAGIFWDAASSTWFQLVWKSSNSVVGVRQINSSGVQIGSSVILSNAVGGFTADVGWGLVKIGGSFYVLRRRVATSGGSGGVGGRYFDLVRYNATTGAVISSAPVAREFVAGVPGPNPALGYDGTNLIVGTTSSETVRFGTTTDAGFSRYAPTTFALVDHHSAGGDIGGGFYGRGCGIDTFSEYGGVRYWIADAGDETFTGGVHVFTFSGSTMTPDATYPFFPTDGPCNVIGHDGANFYSGQNASVLKKYSNFLATSTAGRAFWVEYAWENGANATTPSEFALTVLADRRYLNVSLPARVSGTTTTRVFTGNGTSVPANSAMYSRGTTTGASMQIDAPVSSGANPRIVSDFTTGTPAKIQSQDGLAYLDGAGNFAAPLKLQAGINVAVPSGTGGQTVSVAFPQQMAGVPAIAPTANNSELSLLYITAKSATGFSVRWDRSATGTYSFNWTAIVP